MFIRVYEKLVQLTLDIIKYYVESKVINFYGWLMYG